MCMGEKKYASGNTLSRNRKCVICGLKVQGRTDNSWGPRAIGDHGAPVSSPTPEKANERYQGHLMGPPTAPGPSGIARVLESG
ncbi:unnamed protein product [Staurois parvus]|uniref:Uncharacterized protein n=1 Tax=Staurois parvus TaxID=386267 RepID=A0ABN9G223_9NEOB|nr:unnamed protein product [Staurois parvus]